MFDHLCVHVYVCVASIIHSNGGTIRSHGCVNQYKSRSCGVGNARKSGFNVVVVVVVVVVMLLEEGCRF
jgi:hypothetical protein